MPAHSGNQGGQKVRLLDKPCHAEHRGDSGGEDGGGGGGYGVEDGDSPGHKGANKVAVHNPGVAEQRLQLGGEILQRLLLLHLIIITMTMTMMMMIMMINLTLTTSTTLTMTK